VADAPERDDGEGADGEGPPPGGHGSHPSTPPVVNRALRGAETIIYCMVSVVLVAAAVVLLGAAGYDLAISADEGVASAIRDVLDTLLLVFILVELLSATRETMNQRKIVAEPFLLVGIIASIKEVVVLGIGAKEDLGKDKEKFESAMLGIGTISGLLLVLSIAILLNRRREREPEED
jgi:uncharacterized membrane protein (DUF373 family)